VAVVPVPAITEEWAVVQMVEAEINTISTLVPSIKAMMLARVEVHRTQAVEGHMAHMEGMHMVVLRLALTEMEAGEISIEA